MDRAQLQEWMKQLITLLAELNELEKRFSQLHNEVHESYVKLDNMLNGKGPDNEG